MLKGDRLEKIENYINANRYATLAELIKRFGVSRATVRRDLDQLGSENRVILTRGGAFSINRDNPGSTRGTVCISDEDAEKKRIAKRASSLILPGETVFIDTGASGFYMPGFMHEFKDITVGTNNLKTAVSLADCPGISLIVIGGTILGGAYISIGYFASVHVQNYHFDKAFLCPDAINLNLGCMAANVDEIAVKRALVQSSDEIIVICDHTKFQSRAFISICPITRVSHIITGSQLDKEIYGGFTRNGVTIDLV